MYSRLFAWTTEGTRWLSPTVLTLLALGVLAHWLRLRMGARRYPLVNLATVRGALLFAAAVLIALLGYPEELRPFVYFQF